VKKMVENGIPIHGVGFQCHERAEKNTPDLYDNVRENFERFAALGLELAITEIDITTREVNDAEWVEQAEVYRTFLQVALDMPACNSFVIWGVADKDSWKSPTPLIFDDNFQPKPAYDSLRVLLANPPVRTSPARGHRVRHPLPDGHLVFNPLTNTVSVTSRQDAMSAMVELFDLRGVRTGCFTVPSNAPVSVRALFRSNGTCLLRYGGDIIRLYKAD
jgi:hypothetical protein